MSINTKKARREAELKYRRYRDSYIDRWKTLFNNSIVLENAESNVPKRYFLRILYEQGGIAYDKATGLYLPYDGVGVDVYGLPTEYVLTGANGYVVMRKPDEVCILRANDQRIALKPYFLQQANKVATIDMAIEQNIEACKYMTIAEVEDESQLVSMANEIEARTIGATVIYKNVTAGVNAGLNVQGTGATYLGDKLLEARKEILNETLSTIGIAVSNTDKRERVQSIEVIESRGYALDCINTLIDTINYDAEYGGMKLRVRANTSLVEQVKKEEQESEYKQTID